MIATRNSPRGVDASRVTSWAGTPGPPSPSERYGRLVLGVVAAALITAVVSAPGLGVGYRTSFPHGAIEAATGLITLLVATLAGRRFGRSRSTVDLLIVAALVITGAASVLFVAIPTLAEPHPGAFSSWAPTISRLVAGLLLAAGSWSPADRSDTTHTLRGTLLACGVILLAIAAATAVVGTDLPRATDARVPHGPSRASQLIGDPAIPAIQVALLVVYGLAAIGFARRRDRQLDRLVFALMGGCALLAFARLDYFFFTSLGTEWVYTGDVLRLMACIGFLVGAAGEVEAYPSAMAEQAVAQERVRLARELHDGVAQELVYFLSQARRLQEKQPSVEMEQLVRACERALAESRAAISTFRAPVDESLPAAISRVSLELSRRLDMHVEVEVAGHVRVSAETRETVLRIVAEALLNAARHGEARTTWVRLARDNALRISIRDDGKGFDPTAPSNGGFGLTGMRERAEAIGGRLDLRSGVGSGTEVEVTLP